MEVIPLETNNQSLIGEVTRLKYANGKFFVLDRRAQFLFAFNREGKFLWRIHSIGRGPQEYNRVIDLDVDPGHKLINLYANYPQKLMQYDYEGRFLREVVIHINANSIATQGNWLVMNSANQANLIDGKLADPQLLIKNLEKDSLYTYLPATLKNNSNSCLIFNYGEGIYRYQEELLLFLPLDRRIYSISGKDYRVKYEFDFKNYNLSSGLSMNEIRNSDGIYGLNSFWENKHYCYFQAMMKQFPSHFLYDKKKDSLYYGDFSDDLGNYMPHIIAADDTHMLCYANVSELISNAQYWEKQKGIHHRPVSRLVRQVKETDTPVILLYRFKTS